MPLAPPLQAVAPVVALFGKSGVVGSFGLTQVVPQLRVLVQSVLSVPLQVQVILMLAASALGVIKIPIATTKNKNENIKYFFTIEFTKSMGKLYQEQSSWPRRGRRFCVCRLLEEE